MRGMNKIVIVSQKTRLQELIERFNTKEQAQFYIEHMGDSFDDYLDEDRCYAESLTYVRKKAEQYARVSVIDKSFLCNYIFGRDDLVVCVGRDGLVCNTMKYLEESNLVIGINPDPVSYTHLGWRIYVEENAFEPFMGINNEPITFWEVSKEAFLDQFSMYLERINAALEEREKCIEEKIVVANLSRCANLFAE